MRSAEEQSIATAIIELMRGVIYRESHETAWLALDRHGPAIRDHFAAIGVEVVLDDVEGYAYLRSAPEDDDAEPLPRLIRRRSLTYNVSLLLILLRKRLVDFETTGAEGKLVLSRDELIDLLQVFLADSTNEARVIEKIDATINQVVDLGFLRLLRGESRMWEVRRILKAYVDAQVLSDYAGKLAEYAGVSGRDSATEGSDGG